MRDFVFIPPEMCTSKGPLNITLVWELAMGEHAQRFTSDMFSKNFEANSVR
jgi:hypothetical protein